MTDQPYRPTGPADRPTGPGDEISPAVPDLPAYQPPPRAPAPEADPAVRAEARKKLEELKEFRIHLTVYWVIMTFLVVIWLVSGGWGSYFWPIWPMLGWGVGLALHGFSLRWDQPLSEEQIDAEARRLAQRRGLPPSSGPQD